MTADALMALADGAVLDRAAVVDSLRWAPRWRRYEIGGARFVDAGDDGAVLVYTGMAFREADDPAFVGTMSSLWVRREGRWRLAFYQQTPAGR